MFMARRSGGKSPAHVGVVVVEPAPDIEVRCGTVDVVDVPHPHAFADVVQHPHPAQPDDGASVSGQTLTRFKVAPDRKTVDSRDVIGTNGVTIIRRIVNSVGAISGTRRAVSRYTYWYQMILLLAESGLFPMYRAEKVRPDGSAMQRESR